VVSEGSSLVGFYTVSDTKQLRIFPRVVMPLFSGSNVLSRGQLASKYYSTMFMNVHISRHDVSSLEI
jgi:hypothetical protein